MIMATRAELKDISDACQDTLAVLDQAPDSALADVARYLVSLVRIYVLDEDG
jgi:hypothetical protein